jgi:hypothetical protein
MSILIVSTKQISLYFFSSSGHPPEKLKFAPSSYFSISESNSLALKMGAAVQTNIIAATSVAKV